MSIVEFAKKELALINDGSEIQKMAEQNVLEILEVFSKQGHSNTTIWYVLGIVNRLAEWKPLGELKGTDDEWNELSRELSGDDGPMYQNNRYSSVFKKGKDGIAYNIEGKVFSDNDGESWYTSRESAVDITFPYEVPDEPERVIITPNIVKAVAPKEQD